MKHRVAAAALLVTAYPEKTEGHLLLNTRTCLWREGVHALMLGVGAAAQRARPFLLQALAAAEPALSGQLSARPGYSAAMHDVRTALARRTAGAPATQVLDLSWMTVTAQACRLLLDTASLVYLRTVGARLARPAPRALDLSPGAHPVTVDHNATWSSTCSYASTQVDAHNAGSLCRPWAG